MQLLDVSKAACVVVVVLQLLPQERWKIEKKRLRGRKIRKGKNIGSQMMIE